MKTDNELITEFMGITLFEKELSCYAGDETAERMVIEANFMFRNAKVGQLYESAMSCVKYDTSWDWLMPVVEKISTLDYPSRSIHDRFVFNSNPEAQLYWCEFGQFNYNSGKSLIDAFWTVVAEFIKWHNSQTP